MLGMPLDTLGKYTCPISPSDRRAGMTQHLLDLDHPWCPDVRFITLLKLSVTNVKSWLTAMETHQHSDDLPMGVKLPEGQNAKCAAHILHGTGAGDLVLASFVAVKSSQDRALTTSTQKSYVPFFSSNRTNLP
jgi:hypothetical protein